MPVTCPLCGKSFEYQSRLDRHLARTTPCAPKLKVSQQSPSLPHSCACGRAFSATSGLAQHKRHCHVLKEPKGAKADPSPSDLQQQIEDLQEKLTKLSSESHPSSVQYTSNTDARDQSSHTTNVLNIHPPHHPIVIRNFGEEDTSDYKKEIGHMLDGMRAGTPGETVISKMINLLYNNPDRPQNRTVQIRNKRDNIPYVKTKNGWEARPEREVYPAMIGQACTALMDNQAFELGETLEGLERLAHRSGHLRSAFDVEKDLQSNEKAGEASRLLRPVLYNNSKSLLTLKAIGPA